MFTLNITTDNAAFEHCEEEVARILRAVADKLDRLDGRSDCETGPCVDLNGNKVGSWALTATQAA